MEPLFDFYRQHEEFFYATQLVLAMFGMGATLSLRQFYDVVTRPTKIGLVLAFQFLAMPLVAVAVAHLAGLPNEIGTGLVLLVALPSGALSNVVTFLGRGNVPLSVTSTCASTACCLVMTPLVLRVFASQRLPADFQIPVDETVVNILLLLLLPLSIGMAVGYQWPFMRKHLSRLAVGGSMVVLLCVVVGAIGGGRIDIFHYGWATPVWIIVFVTVTLLLTYGLTLALRYPQADAFTLGIEVAMRNGNLGIALCIPLFEPLTEDNLLHQGSLYVCLFGAGTMMVVGMAAVARRHLRFARQRRAGLPEV